MGQDKAKLNMKMDNTLVEDFKYYVKNGQSHPRKVKAMQKALA